LPLSPITISLKAKPYKTKETTNQAHMTTEPNCPDLSFVFAVYNEESNIDPLYNKIIGVLKKECLTYELIFINDGSTDNTLNKLDSLLSTDSNVVIIDLARNFGQQKAITAGLEHSSGKAVIVMDADLQDSPDAIAEFLKYWRNGYEVVYAIRMQRKEHILKRLAYSVFYRVMRATSSIEMPLDAGDFCIMDRKVVDLLNKLPERNRFVRGIRSWVGFKQIGIEVTRGERHSGESKYSLSKLISLALDGLVSFSYAPVRLISTLGIAVSIISIFLAVFYGLKKLMFGLHPPGFATLVVMISFLSGIQLITIGVIGEYVGRIFEEVKQRPIYTVRQIRGGRFKSESKQQ
jgi:polyisoprenyl-phosphate glycosyltransferase